MATRRRRQRRRTFDFVIPASLRLGKDRSSRRKSRTGAKGIVVSRVLAGTLLLVMTVLLAWFFLDMRFYVSAAQIQGTALIDAEEVYRASGLDGYSIFYINRAQVTKRICTEVPGIEQVHVDCQLPDRLLIRIEERNVRFIWHAAGTAFLVDGTGRLLQIVTQGWCLSRTWTSAHSSLAIRWMWWLCGALRDCTAFCPRSGLLSIRRPKGSACLTRAAGAYTSVMISCFRRRWPACTRSCRRLPAEMSR